MRIPTSPVVLVGNYLPDRQFSMLQYAGMLERELHTMGARVILTTPTEIFGRLLPSNKWLGYIDKLLLFPRSLKKQLRKIESSTGKKCIVHVCDHSNSPVIRGVRNRPTLLTCHDMIAIRSAMGEFPGEMPRLLGRVLQDTIRNSIPRATRIACVSHATEKELLRILPEIRGRTHVVYNGFNAPYHQQPDNVVKQLLEGLSLPANKTLLLHVGNNAWYKNRIGVLQIFRAYRQSQPDLKVHLVLAGPELDPRQSDFARQHELTDSLQCTGPLDNPQLEALYCKADALIFPSRCEGFGWPPVEAQSCGCPVVASNNGSLAEILEDSALTAPWDDLESHVHNLSQLLTDPRVRQNLATKGLQNANRFSAQKMAAAFCDIYCELEGPHTHTAA